MLTEWGTIGDGFPLLFRSIGFLRVYTEHSITTINVTEENPCSFLAVFPYPFRVGSGSHESGNAGGPAAS